MKTWRRFQAWLRAQRCRAFGHQVEPLVPIGTGTRCLRCGRTTVGWVSRTVTRIPPAPISMAEVRARSRRAVSTFNNEHRGQR